MAPQAYLLNSLGVLSFAGPDALPFLQGQISCDVHRLTAGESQLGAYSTPQGRVLAVMHLIQGEGELLAILPQEVLESCLIRLRKYVLRAKVSLSDARGRIAVGGSHGADLASAAPAVQSFRMPQDLSRSWVLVRGASDTVAEASAEHERSWRLANVRAGIPQIYASTEGEFVAQMLNLDLIDGISFNKGCYTGQEIIARTQHLGRIKRRMFRFRLEGAPPVPGAALDLGAAGHATVVECAADGASYECLAVMPLAAADAIPPAALLPLPYRVEAVIDR